MSRESEIYRTTVIGAAGNVALLAFKFVAGIVGHSAAMVADAVHSLSDLATDIVVLVFVRISSRPQDESHDYGHGKYETLATAIIGLALLGVAAGIIWNGAVKICSWIRGNDLPEPGKLALLAALVSIIVKELLYQYTVRVGRNMGSQAVVANAWHHRSDALSSIGTAIGIGGAILLGKRWTVLDPLASVVVGAFIVKVAFDLLRQSLGELTERSLPADVEQRILDIVCSEPEVHDPHHLRTRCIGNHYAIEMHIRLAGGMPLSEAHMHASSIEDALKKEYGRETHVILHLEPVEPIS